MEVYAEIECPECDTLQAQTLIIDETLGKRTCQECLHCGNIFDIRVRLKVITESYYSDGTPYEVRYC